MPNVALKFLKDEIALFARVYCGSNTSIFVVGYVQYVAQRGLFFIYDRFWVADPT